MKNFLLTTVITSLIYTLPMNIKPVLANRITEANYDNLKIKENTNKSINAGCYLVLHCNAKEKEIEIVAQNSPFLSKFVIKKTSQFYKTIS